MARTKKEDHEPFVAVAPIRVVLAEDHALMRRSLRTLLDGEDGVAVIAEAADLVGVNRHVLGTYALRRGLLSA